jgi:hypothetical protein
MSDPDVALGGSALEEGFDQCCLSDPRFTGHKDYLSLARKRLLQRDLQLP